MNAINLKEHSKYFFIASFILIVTLSLILIWPFLTAILGSMILAYVFYPAYKALLRWIKNKNICALLMSLLVLILLLLPILLAANAMLNEATEAYYMIRQTNIEDIGDQILTKYFGENIEIGEYVKDMLNKLAINIMQRTEKFILGLPEKILNFFIMFFVMFYLFKDGKSLVNFIKKELPLKEKYRKSLSKRFNDVIYATVYGLIVTAIVQGAVAAFGLYIFNVSSPLLWGIVMVILAMLPFIGCALIWFPAAVIKLITGETFNGIGLLIYGLLIVSTIDNIIRPKIIGGRAKIHPVFALLGVLGGLKIFGLIGIIIGPLAIAIMLVFFELYLSEKKQKVFVK